MEILSDNHIGMFNFFHSEKKDIRVFNQRLYLFLGFVAYQAKNNFATRLQGFTFHQPEFCGNAIASKIATNYAKVASQYIVESRWALWYTTERLIA